MMNKIKLKVCGMKEMNNIQEVSLLDPDYMGFIFFQDSPRFVGDDFEIVKSTGGVKKVGVFVNEETAIILGKVKLHGLEYVQLHGDESVEQCAELKQNKVKIIKAFRVDEELKFANTIAYEEVCDFFLFDTKGKLYGGNSTRFDWQILSRYNQRVPFFLSGGIGVDSAKTVNELSHMNIHSIDINSGVEIAPGVKDVARIKDIQMILNTKE
jgi:phosphoribosylanthranilate isomerase